MIFWGGGGHFFEAGHLLTLGHQGGYLFEEGIYSWWVLIGGWTLIQINVVFFLLKKLCTKLTIC